MQEERRASRTVGNDHAISARPSFALPRDSLLDETATEVGIKQATLGSGDCLAQTFVGDPFLPGKPREPSGFEDAHSASLTL
jgi:hypothetical protein